MATSLNHYDIEMPSTTIQHEDKHHAYDKPFFLGVTPTYDERKKERYEGGKEMEHGLEETAALLSTIEEGEDENEVDEENKEQRTNSKSGINDGWHVATNLDTFYHDLYQFVRGHGTASIIVRQVTSCVSLLFAIAASVFLLTCIRWGNLLTHRAPATMDTFLVFASPSPLILLYAAALSLFFLVHCTSAVSACRSARRVSAVLDSLPGRGKQKGPLLWPSLLSQFLAAHRSHDLLVHIGETPDAHHIVSRILRHTNYWTALTNHDVLGCCHAEWWHPLRVSRCLFWWMDILLLRPMIHSTRFTFNSMKVATFKTRLRLAAVTHLLVLPILLPFMILYFLIRHAKALHTQGSVLGPCAFSDTARYRFRQYNELPHLLEARLSNSVLPATQFLAQFPRTIVGHIAALLSFMANSILAVLLLLAVVDDDLMFSTFIHGRNLVWYAALLTTVSAASRAFPLSAQLRKPRAALQRLTKTIRYADPAWTSADDPGHYAAYQDMYAMFTSRVILFLGEITSVLLTPYVLGIHLPARARSILQFIEDNTEEVHGLGAVCRLAYRTPYTDRTGHTSSTSSLLQASWSYRNRGGGSRSLMAQAPLSNPSTILFQPPLYTLFEEPGV